MANEKKVKKQSKRNEGTMKPKQERKRVEKPAVDEVRLKSSKHLSVLQSKFAKKLEGARFRYINEQLYTQRGEDAFRDFQHDPDLSEVYHSGYREQVHSWPENPLDKIIAWIKAHHKDAVIADLGLL